MKNVINVIKLSIKALLTKKSNIDYSKWIFSSSFNTKFNYNSKYLFEHILKHETGITPLFVINDTKLKNVLQRKYGKKHFIDTRTKSGQNEVLKSGVWLTSAGLPLYGLFLNKRRVIVNLWHGVPLKKIALLENNISYFKKLYFQFVFSNNYTYVITTSTSLVSIMAKSFNVNEKKVKILGQPRNDLLFKKSEKKQTVFRLFRSLPDSDKIILYAPTYREYAQTKLFPFEDFDINELNSFLENHKIILFIRMHQSEIQNLTTFEKSKRIQFINDDKVKDIMEILNIFDLLVTDYSSIYIDYLLSHKPIIFLPYDKKKYSNKRGFNFHYNEVTPGPKPNTLVEFMREINLLLYNKNYYKEERININNYFNEIKVNSSNLIIDFIQKEIEKK